MLNRGTSGTRRGFKPFVLRAISAMNSGVVPQHPPTMLTHPCSAKFCTMSLNSAAVASNPPIPSGMPALG